MACLRLYPAVHSLTSHRIVSIRRSVIPPWLDGLAARFIFNSPQLSRWGFYKIVLQKSVRRTIIGAHNCYFDRTNWKSDKRKFMGHGSSLFLHQCSLLGGGFSRLFIVLDNRMHSFGPQSFMYSWFMYMIVALCCMRNMSHNKWSCSE